MNEARSARDDLLDAALALFADRGFGATSIRAIIAAAGANLNSLHYHFGSKDALGEALLVRAMAPVNEARRASLEAAGVAASVDVRECIDALYRPIFQHFLVDPSPRRRLEVRFVSQLRHDPRPEVHAMLGRHQGNFAEAFERLLAAALGVGRSRLGPIIRFVNESAWGTIAQGVLGAEDDEGSVGAQGGSHRRAARATLDAFLEFATAGACALAARDGVRGSGPGRAPGRASSDATGRLDTASR